MATQKPTTYKFESIAMHGNSIYSKSTKTVYTVVDGGPEKPFNLGWGLGIVNPSHLHALHCELALR